TFGGNPLACAAALAVLDTLEKENLIQQTHEKGEWLMQQLRALNSPHIKEVRGKGLMIGVAFDQETKPLVQLLFEKGILANATAGNILRLVPPLIITYEDMQLLVNKIQEAINEL
ncbi:MAG: aminotransferase class III-fold pyridoxal phosphate-dependent enzyme, partial [Bacteroidales bacterium]